MKKRVLITGATGFVGSHILEALIKDDSFTVIAACRNKDKLLPEFKGEVRTGDLRDESYIQEVVKGVDAICHAAAWTSLWAHKRQSRINYLQPSINLINYAKNSGVSQFIYPSSTSAAAPDMSDNALNPGIPRKFWPHLCNVIAIENHLKENTDAHFSGVTLRLGIFVGQRYSLGLLPILLPRLKTHLVPWVAGGKTRVPLTDGQDIGRAFLQTLKTTRLNNYEAFNITGPEQPTVREVIEYINKTFHYPKPHFSVPFAIAYPFAWLMEKLDWFVPWEPLVTRSIIHLLEETHVNNNKAAQYLNYHPQIHWQDSVRAQIEELHKQQSQPMSMAVAE